LTHKEELYGSWTTDRPRIEAQTPKEGREAPGKTESTENGEKDGTANENQENRMNDGCKGQRPLIILPLLIFRFLFV
jgi:hypothetical protein